MSEFFSMGGYAVFVWPAFLLSFAVLAGLVIISLHTYRDQKNLLARLETEDNVPEAADRSEV